MEREEGSRASREAVGILVSDLNINLAISCGQEGLDFGFNLFCGEFELYFFSVLGMGNPGFHTR